MENLDTKYETGVWYGWNGGECPVHPDTIVDWVEPSGSKWRTRAGDIVCNTPFLFRIVTPYVEPAPKLECWVYTDQDGKIMGEARIDQMQVAEVMARHYGGRVVRMVEADE